MKLTDEQIENWRKILVMRIGPFALLMPKETIVEYVSLDRDGNAKPSGSTKGSIFTYLPPKDKTDYFDYNLALVRLQNAMSNEGFKGVVK